jgi:hypothetical protein
VVALVWKLLGGDQLTERVVRCSNNLITLQKRNAIRYYGGKHCVGRGPLHEVGIYESTFQGSRDFLGRKQRKA